MYRKIDVNLGHDHGTEHSHSEHDHGTHSEISAVYKFNCLEPEDYKILRITPEPILSYGKNKLSG